MKLYILSKTKKTIWDPDESPLPSYLTFTTNPANADIFVADTEFSLTSAIESCITYNRRQPKACILWTNEPYYSTHKEKKITIYGIPTYVFNIWNQNVLFTNGTHLFQNIPKLPMRPLHRDRFRCEEKPIKMCAIMTYPTKPSTDQAYRTNFAIHAQIKGICDIYGRGWPNNLSKEDSSQGEWWKSKPGILSQYDYTLAFENCIQPYYVTEKLWDPIFTMTLPIYRDNRTIYQTFPRDSFIDVDDYSTKEKLYQKIQSMSVTEWTYRMDGCYAALEQAWKVNNGSYEPFWTQATREVLNCLEKIK